MKKRLTIVLRCSNCRRRVGAIERIPGMWDVLGASNAHGNDDGNLYWPCRKCGAAPTIEVSSLMSACERAAQEKKFQLLLGAPDFGLV